LGGRVRPASFLLARTDAEDERGNRSVTSGWPRRPPRADDTGLTAERVESYCREVLASYKKPRQVVFVDALPRNALGKVLKHEVLRELIEAEE
jgi:acyl-CoA synthetase (AMP-forming)/AMP-acid ligase II